MILGIEKELSVFLQAILAGNLVYMAYCTIRVFRRIIRHNLFWVSVEDILFWILTGFYMFTRIYQTSNGTIRWYFVLGVFTGGIFTHRIIKKIMKKYIDKRKKRE
jgi:hypothetical protein